MNKDKAVAQGTPSLIERLRVLLDNEVIRDDMGEKAYALVHEAAEEIIRLDRALSYERIDVPHIDRQLWKEAQAEVAALSAQVVELQQQLVHSTVTRASAPPSVGDGGTTAAIIAYIDGFYVSGNSIPIDRPWINAESWKIAKELLALGLPLEHALIEQECVYRRKLRAYGDETRAKSPLQERLSVKEEDTGVV